jgi:hypothetical protein
MQEEIGSCDIFPLLEHHFLDTCVTVNELSL